jgi:hypothetical protein
MINEAFLVLAEGMLDAGLQSPDGPAGAGRPIRLDVLLAVMQAIRDEFGIRK